MSARFWWRVRRFWHYPSMLRECVWPTPRCQIHRLWGGDPLFRMELREFLQYAWWLYWKSPRLILLDLRDALICIRNWIWSNQPLRCNGNDGGWRTKFCEWLEDQARRREETHTTEA